MLNSISIRQDFPIFSYHYHGKPLIYLDNAATTQKPQAVIQAVHDFYTSQNATVRRSIYPLAAEATRAYESVREQVRQFIGAASSQEIIFTKGTTEGINLVATAFAESRLNPGDEILISAMEHHSNLIPWQQLCLRKGAKLQVIPMNERGELLLEKLPELLSHRTKMLAITYISNSLGTINPIREIIELAHAQGVPVLVDGAQSVAHYPLNMSELDCDFFVFSGHKMFAPTGIGVLYAKAEHLTNMQPYQFGGEMIRLVTFEETIFANAPAKFEAGTPNVEGAIGLGAAIHYINQIGKANIGKHLNDLRDYATEQLSAIKGLTIIGTAQQKTAILSFKLEGIHPHDAATFLGEAGFALRAGHHCTQPVMAFLGIPGTLRASFTIYNTREEIDQLAETIRAAKRFFR